MGNCVRIPARKSSSLSSSPNPLKNPGSSSSNSRENKNDKENNENKDGMALSVRETPKIFSLEELNMATLGFRRDMFLGEGGFGEVFKGWLNPNAGIAVAVKKSKFPYSCQGIKEWQAEVKLLAKYSHPNLVNLIGFCWEKNIFLLVYEYMPKGSLDKHLFNGSGEILLNWGTRIKIAIGAARGLAFLHTSKQSVIYRDFKTSNILLDENYNAKLSDFGLAKLGPVDGKSHVTTRVMGTHGYAAPEYVATGHLYIKSDVYGFGVVLLEMLTGRPAIDESRAQEEIELVNWAVPRLQDKRTLKKLMDPKLENHYAIKGACLAAELATKCLQYERNNRPSMDQVLERLLKIDAIVTS